MDLKENKSGIIHLIGYLMRLPIGRGGWPAILCLGIYVGDKLLSGVYLSGLSLERGTENPFRFFISSTSTFCWKNGFTNYERLG